jgi:hypothetical protein
MGDGRTGVAAVADVRVGSSGLSRVCGRKTRPVLWSEESLTFAKQGRALAFAEQETRVGGHTSVAREMHCGED